MLVPVLSNGCFGQARVCIEVTFAHMLQLAVVPVVLPCYEQSPCDPETLSEMRDTALDEVTAANLTLRQVKAAVLACVEKTAPVLTLGPEPSLPPLFKAATELARIAFDETKGILASAIFTGHQRGLTEFQKDLEAAPVPIVLVANSAHREGSMGSSDREKNGFAEADRSFQLSL
jgi:hypothetical protein